MTTAAFDGFEDLNIGAWIGNAFSDLAINEKKRRAPIRRRQGGRAVSQGLDIWSFIARGSQNAVSRTANSDRDQVSQSTDFSSSHQRVSDRISFSIVKATPAATLVAAAGTAVSAGILSISALLSEPTRAALGENGVARLVAFSELASGWDDGNGAQLDVDSLRQMDAFFSSCGFTPSRVGVFMSHEGKLIANWLDQHDSLVELEFHGDEIAAFFEADGSSFNGSLGDRRLLRKISSSLR